MPPTSPDPRPAREVARSPWAGYNSAMLSNTVSLATLVSVTTLSFVTVLCAVGCSDDPGAVQADVRYRVRCDTGCQSHNVAVLAIDGEDGARVSCSATSAQDGNRLLTFAAYQDNANGIELVGALFSPEGSGTVIGNSCSVKVRDDENDFRGGCRSSEPTPEDPCQVTNLKIDGSRVSGAILCTDLAGENTVGQLLNIASLEDENTPFVFSFANCRGL